MHAISTRVLSSSLPWITASAGAGYRSTYLASRVSHGTPGQGLLANTGGEWPEFERLLRVARAIRRLVSSRFHYKTRVAAVAECLPKHAWYNAALRLSRAQNVILKLLGRTRPVSAPGALDMWLWELSKFGPYPFPWRVAGLEVIETQETRLYFSTHITFFDVALHVMAEKEGGPLPYVVAGSGRIEEDGCCAIIGSKTRLRGIPADARTLARMRALLRGGTSVACMAESMRGAELQESPLEVARLTGALVVFTWVEQEADGTFLVQFQKAPRPYVRSEEDKRINMEAMSELQNRDLRRVLC